MSKKIKNIKNKKDESSNDYLDYKSIIRYKDKTGIRIYIGEEESFEKRFHIQIIDKKNNYYGSIYIYPDTIGLMEFWWGYNVVKDYKIARHWLLQELRKFGKDVSNKINNHLNIGREVINIELGMAEDEFSKAWKKSQEEMKKRVEKIRQVIKEFKSEED